MTFSKHLSRTRQFLYLQACYQHHGRGHVPKIMENCQNLNSHLLQVSTDSPYQIRTIRDHIWQVNDAQISTLNVNVHCRRFSLIKRFIDFLCDSYDQAGLIYEQHHFFKCSFLPNSHCDDIQYIVITAKEIRQRIVAYSGCLL